MPIARQPEDNPGLVELRHQWREGRPEFDRDRYSMWPIDLAVKQAEKRMH